MLHILLLITKFAVRLQCTSHDSRPRSWPCASSRLPGQILSAANSRTAVRRAPRTSRGKNTSVKLLISPESWQIFRQPTSHCLAWQSDDRMLFECFHSTANDGQRLDSEQPLLARGSNVEAISNPAEWRERATELAHKL